MPAWLRSIGANGTDVTMILRRSGMKPRAASGRYSKPSSRLPWPITILKGVIKGAPQCCLVKGSAAWPPPSPVSSALTSRNCSNHPSGALEPCSNNLPWIPYPCLGLSPARKGPGRFSSHPLSWPGSCFVRSTSPAWASLRRRCFRSPLGTRWF